MPRRNIGKSKRKKKNKSTTNGKQELRFAVGERVECKMNTGKFVSGKIVQHWWRAPNWPKQQVAPYQVRLDNGQLIFVPFDDANIIRKNGDPPTTLRYQIGTRVLCKIAVQPTETWEPGVVIATDFPLPTNANLTMPYQIKLDQGRVIFAPVDQDTYIKLDPDRQGEEITEAALNMIQGKLRFEIGDEVECKIRPAPETWARGTITNTKIPHPQNPNIKVPYEILLHQNNQKIFAPADSDDVIRKASPGSSADSSATELQGSKYRFTIGTKVLCKMHATKEIWEPGTIIVVGYTSGAPNAPEYPYQILLENGKAIVAPMDDNACIKLASAEGSAKEPTKESKELKPNETSLDGEFFSETNEIQQGIQDLSVMDDIEELD